MFSVLLSPLVQRLSFFRKRVFLFTVYIFVKKKKIYGPSVPKHLLYTKNQVYFHSVYKLDGVLLIGSYIQENTRIYGLLLAPAEGFSLRPSLFLSFGQKKGIIMLFYPIFGIFCCLVVTLKTFSSNLSNFEMNPKNPKKSKKHPEN